MKFWSGTAKAAYLVRLVVVDREAITFVVTYIVNVLPHHHDSARTGQIAAGNQFEQRGFSRTVRSHHADNRGFFDVEVGFQRKSNLLVDQTACVFFTQLINLEKWNAHNLYSQQSHTLGIVFEQTRAPARDAQFDRYP